MTFPWLYMTTNFSMTFPDFPWLWEPWFLILPIKLDTFKTEPSIPSIILEDEGATSSNKMRRLARLLRDVELLRATTFGILPFRWLATSLWLSQLESFGWNETRKEVTKPTRNCTSNFTKGRSSSLAIWPSIHIRLSEIQNSFSGPKALFSHACLFTWA